MLLSVVVYNHKLTAGQWIGTGIVFAGISVEAWVKRTGERTSEPKSLLHTGKLTIPSRDPRETRCTGEGKGKDQGIVARPRTLRIRWAVVFSFLSSYLSLLNHAHSIVIECFRTDFMPQISHQSVAPPGPELHIVY